MSQGHNPWPYNVKVEPSSQALPSAFVPTHSIPTDVSTTQSSLPGQQFQPTSQQLCNISTRNGVVSESGLSQAQTPRPRLFLTAVEIPLYRKPTPTTASSHWPVPPAPEPAPFSAPASIPTHAAAPVLTSVSAMPSAGLQSSEQPLTLITPVTITKSTAWRFTREQKRRLESFFRTNMWPNQDERTKLGEQLGAPDIRIKKWFERRQYNDREVSNKDMGLVASPNTSPVTTPPCTPSEERNISLPMTDKNQSDREETPFAEGVLGSAAIRYRPYAVPSRSEQATRPSAEKPVAALSKPSRKNKLQSFEVAGRITPFLRGGSIVKAEDIKTFVGIMEAAGDMDGKKYILNALLSTKPLPILTRILKALPWEVETSVKIKLERMVKNLTTEKDGIPDIVKSATELHDKWNNTNSGLEHTSSRLTRASTTESARRARPSPGTDNFFGGQHQDLSLLPKFTKASTSTPKASSSMTPNHNFFKEITNASTPTQTTKKMPARLSISTRPQQDNRGGSSSPASASALSSSPSVLTTAPPTRSRRLPSDSTPAQRPQMESTPPQFSVTKETVRRLSHTSSSLSSASSSKLLNQTPKKTVRFKGDHELVQTRFIERVNYESTDEDEDDYGEGIDRGNDYSSSSSMDMDMDVNTEMEVDDGYLPSFWPPFFAPSTPAPTPQPSTAPLRPAFIMTSQEMEDLVAGRMWRLPIPLLVEHEYTVANGQESVEAATQAEREARTPAVAYPSLAMIPSSPAEPDPETNDESLPRQIALFEESTDPAQVLLGSLTQLAQYLAVRSHVDTQRQIPLPPQ
ncbi:hypothetical protein BGZ50_007069 [Haplosporangium sp. Z 11]|nr:hypothetical protein BGZ50_007069 [Haplosporangium sp. Z 11]